MAGVIHTIDTRRLVSLYSRGLNQYQLADIFEVSRQTIRRALVRCGVEIRPPGNKPGCGGPEHNCWKGENIGYSGAHQRVRRVRGAPSKCEVCGTEQAKKFEWANLNGEFHDPYDYIRVCVSCHRTVDGFTGTPKKLWSQLRRERK